MPAKNPEKRTLAAIMFTDLVGYSALAQRNEALALALLAESQRLLRAQFPGFHGREVKSTGDGFLVEFPNALEATQCAVEIQSAIAAHNAAQPAERQIRVRIGLHVGEVVHRENDLYGDGVNVAARIEPLASGGGICLSGTVYDQVRNKLALKLAKLDSPKLKHIEVPMDVYRVESGGATVPAAAALPKPSIRHWPWILAVALVAAGAVYWGRRHPKENFTGAPPATNAAPAAIDPKSIAVLPFANLSADKGDEYLSDGLTEELLNVLAQVDDLRVSGRTSAFAFKGRGGGDVFQQVSRQLRVATVLEGSVRKAGERLRVNVQLYKLPDGLLLWSDEYNGDMQDIFAFQSEVARRVVQSLSAKLGVEDQQALTNTPTANPEAHRLYLLGRYHFNQGTFAGFTASMPFFEQAIRLDTNFALAYCGLADAYGFTSGILLPGREGWAKEKALAQKALAIDPNLAEAHFSLGLALASSFSWTAGENEIRRAIKMNPNMAVAYDQYAFLLTCLGRHGEAIAMSRRAIQIEPLSPLMNIDLGWWLMYARRYGEAAAQCRRALELDAKVSLGHWALGWSLFWRGDQTGAVAEFELACRLEPQPFFQAPLGYAYGVAGEPAKAGRILQDLGAASKTNYVSPGLLAYPSLGLGEKEEVFSWLGQSLEAQDFPCQFLKVDPAFDVLRGDPRFQTLLKKANLAP